MTAALPFSLSAIEEPGRTQASIAEGSKLYGAECAACPGLDGRTPTDDERISPL